MIGDRLKLARESAGMTLRDLEAAMGGLVSHQAIHKYETDQTMPGSAVLRSLASALGVSERYLLNPRRIELTGIEARPGFDGGAKALRVVEAGVLSAVEKYIDVEELVPGAEAKWTTPPGFPIVIRRDEDVEEAALKLRAAWGLGTQAVGDIPGVLEEKGVKVISSRLTQRTPAILCLVQRGNHPAIPVVVVDPDAPGERQRLALVQELARLVLDLDHVANVAERMRERFARAFLLVRDAFIYAVGKMRRQIPMAELLGLKAIFGVAIVQIIERCVELGIVADIERRRLIELCNSRGWTRAPFREPAAVPPQRPSRFERLCLRAFAEEIVSESRVAELLGIPAMELTNHFELGPGLGM
jgi:transcriptional regulator with XRE-family HTH domain/Zn-dependent peptidase ImmA (M78 family)